MRHGRSRRVALRDFDPQSFFLDGPEVERASQFRGFQGVQSGVLALRVQGQVMHGTHSLLPPPKRQLAPIHPIYSPKPKLPTLNPSFPGPGGAGRSSDSTVSGTPASHPQSLNAKRPRTILPKDRNEPLPSPERRGLP